MIEKIIVSVLAFLLFTYVFIFKLIKRNDTTYFAILIMQAIGILINFIQIIFNIFNGIVFRIIVYLFCIIIPAVVFIIESKNINFSELVSICMSKVFMFFRKNKKGKRYINKASFKVR